MAVYGEYVPVSCHVKFLGGSKIACYGICEDSLFYVGVVGSGESYSYCFVCCCRTYLPRDCLVKQRLSQ